MSAPREQGRVVTALLVLLVLAAIAAALWTAIGAFPHAPVHLTIDGERIVEGFDLSALDTGEKALLVGGLMVALLTILVVVPVILLLVLTMVLLALMSAVGLPLLALGAVLAVLVAPIALLAWLLWRALRPAPNIAT